MVAFAEACLGTGEELFRIYVYDCPPYAQPAKHPVTGEMVDFGASRVAREQGAFLDALARKDHVALRKGTLILAGWKLKPSVQRTLIQNSRCLQSTDLIPDFKQKGVDIKIGLDVAWLSSKRIVDRVILVTGDSDFVPAMKFARREGVQVVLVTLGHRVIASLIEHADEFRRVDWPTPQPAAVPPAGS
ncbi:MAG: NYN domain-containing protein [Deltaproteobacteria bacterium]|nr:NYN domain-containing protein [Deltaproteobacteria bacterium]